MSKTITILNLPIEKYYNLINLEIILDNTKEKYKLIQLDVTIELEKVFEIITYSDLLIINGPNVFGYYGLKIIEKINEYYNSGGIIIYEIHPNKSELQDTFLNYYQMKSSDIRLRSQTNYVIQIAKTSHSFRDRYLSKDIDNIMITQPNHIEYWGTTEPILMCNGGFLAVDSKTDLIVNTPTNSITPIVFQENINEGLFICINGDIELNCFPNPIDNENNLRFLTNLHGMILRKKSRYEIAYNEYRKIEHNIINIVMTELKNIKGEKWIELIPQKIIDIIKLKKQNINTLDEALDFIQIKKIIEHNWSYFQKYFEGENNSGKEKSLKWMDWVNENRKVIAHPVKDLENKHITYNTINELRKISQMLMEKQIN